VRVASLLRQAFRLPPVGPDDALQAVDGYRLVIQAQHFAAVLAEKVSVLRRDRLIRLARTMMAVGVRVKPWALKFLGAFIGIVQRHPLHQIVLRRSPFRLLPAWPGKSKNRASITDYPMRLAQQAGRFLDAAQVPFGDLTKVGHVSEILASRSANSSRLRLFACF
jgi:hypothetical protein